MANKYKLKKISFISTMVLILLAIVAGYFIYTNILNFQLPTTSETVSTKVEIKMDLFDQLKNPKKYGVPVSIEETGFGRANPFANYKATPVVEEESAESKVLPAS